MKSHESVLIELAQCIYKDACAQCTTLRPDKRDIDTLISRVKHEGLSFLTITLPSLGSDLERALDEGRIASNHFRSFRKWRTIPAFLQGMFMLVFDSGEGSVLNEPDISAIKGIRQIAYSFKKLALDCTPERVRKSIAKFKKIEQDLYRGLDPVDIATFSSVSRVLWSNVFAYQSFLVNETIPKHGPGATAEKLSGNQKFNLRNWHERLENYFPLFHFVFSSENAYGSEDFEKVSLISENEEQPVRVISVPKTLKGPRIIAIEPVCMQYAQQAISSRLIPILEKSPLTKGHVNFTDQSINGDLAVKSSKDGKFATIDLSSASDRVPLPLALSMFDCVPEIRNAIGSCRSRRAQLPSGEVIPLRKFASMGSALCFPVEAMYFYTICIKALLEEYELPSTYFNIKRMSKKVWVYGDDIIVPVDAVDAVLDNLQKYYCKVNVNKSFWTGKFRESCGTEAYDGEVVTPTYVRQMPPKNRGSSTSLISWVETSNLFYKEGYWSTASYMKNMCERHLGKLPIVGDECGGLGWESFQRVTSIHRWNIPYQVHEVKTWVPKPVHRTDVLEGYPALMKSLSNLERRKIPEPQTDKDHLTKTPRYGAVTLKRRWVRPY